MNIAGEVDALHDLCELHQRLRPEVQRELADGTQPSPMGFAEARTCDRIVQVCRAILAASEG